VGSGQPVTILDVAKLTVATVGSGRTQLAPYPPEHRRVEVGDFFADISKIQQTVGWQPRVSLRDGLERTARFLQQYREQYWTRGARSAAS
jgi:UDP-glucose 4-epimerase